MTDTEQTGIDRQTLEQMRRGLIKEIEAARGQQEGKRAQLAAIERELEKDKTR